MSDIQITIDKTGFPVKIGTIELWFDSSLENLKNFFNVEKIAQEKVSEAEKKAKHVHFPDKIEDFTDVDTKTVNAAFDVTKEFIATQYDVIFGNGTFKKIYKKYPDILALSDAIDPTLVAIANKINEQEAERSAKIEDKKNEYLKKKSMKKK